MTRVVGPEPGQIYRSSGRPVLLRARGHHEPEDTTSHSAVWQEQLAVGDTPSRVAVGIEHAGQAHNQLVSLLAGTLLGLGGAALLSAVQEARHARD
jgi:Cu/Zn superoxide dismutase